MTKQFTLSNRQLQIAANGLTLCLPWPTELLGEYGANSFDGSPVSADACDRVMDAWVAAALDAAGMNVTAIIAGRAIRDGKLTPCVNVTLFPGQPSDRVRRVEWIDGKSAH